MNRPPGSQYQWPDRGWQHESEFHSALVSGLEESGVGPIARGQTLMEAEQLVSRLSSTVQTSWSIDTSFQISPLNQAAPGNSVGNSDRMCKGMRVHGLLAGSCSDWLPATIVHANASSYSLAYDDGIFEEKVPSARVRRPKRTSSERRHLLGEDPSSFRDFLRQRIGVGGAGGALSSSAGHLQCQYAAFETGSVNRAGHIDLDKLSADPTTPQHPQFEHLEGLEHPPKLRIGFIQIPQGCNPKKRALNEKVPGDSSNGCILPEDVSVYHGLQQLLQGDQSAPRGLTSLQAPSSRTHQLAYTLELCPDESVATVTPLQVVAEPEVRDSIHLLGLLHSVFADSKCVAQWLNPNLTQKLLRQLEDPLSIASGTTPEWFDSLPRQFPFLFSLAARQKQLASTGFGELSHSVNWVQAQVAQARREQLADRQAAAERASAAAAEHEDMARMAEAAELLAEVEDEVDRERIGTLKSDIVKVPRENILSSAEKLMVHHASSKTALEVQFSGEDGFGSGVTQNFYCAVAVALQLRSVNSEVPMWMGDCGIEGFVGSASGLYPMPQKQDGDTFKFTCERYCFLGRLMSKALRDGFIVPVPLARCFLAMVLGKTPSYGWLPSVDTTGGVITAYAHAVADAEQRGEGLAELGKKEFTRHYLKLDYDMSLEVYLTSAEACWVDPISGIALTGDENRELRPDELKEYVGAVMQWWFQDGVKGQLEAFTRGFDEVVQMRKLLELFSATELLCMLCGDNYVEWDSISLNQNLRPTASLTTHSPVFKLLVEYLLQLENSDRAAFLNFVTACPRLPPGGVAALNIEVSPSGTESKIPTSQTCVPKLYIPNYETKEDLQKGFLTAFQNAEAGGFHERAM